MIVKQSMIVSLILLSLKTSIVPATEFMNDIVMERRLLGSGFHREIKTVFTVPDKFLSQSTSLNCDFMIFETLPSGVYADPFQIQSLEPFGGPKVHFDREVNIEAAEFLSKSHELFIYFNLSKFEIVRGLTNVSINLPIHARYHKPSSEVTISHAMVTILHPGLYSNCSSIYGTEDPVIWPCNKLNSSLCAWTHLAYRSSSPVIKMHVPVGLEKDKPLVITVTLLVSIMVCGILVRVIGPTQDNLRDKDS